MPTAKYMRLAFQLAQRGKGYVNPNPMVGAVLVKNGKIVGKGYHRVFGGPHAEINALANAGKKAKGATMYVTLEPCSHSGKTPPCTRAIINAGIKKVVCASLDPNPLNNGQGLRELRKNKIEVEKGIFKKEARELNEKFFTYHEKKRPFISIKCAMTLDGKTATVTGNSKWITCRRSRDYVHRLRHEHDAIMVGVNTVKIDNPRLTARLRSNMRKPCIVISDSRLSIPPDANVVKNAWKKRVIVATTKKGPLRKKKILLSRGVEVLTVSSRKGGVHLAELFRKLAKLGITSILVEGGGKIVYSLFHSKLVDKIYFFYAPKILGGKNAPTSVEGPGIKDLNKAIRIRDIIYSRSGEDMLITGYPR